MDDPYSCTIDLDFPPLVEGPRPSPIESSPGPQETPPTATEN